jgi:cyclopropane fatty-acyl-phospholipid synthase-like methyltransferase
MTSAYHNVRLGHQRKRSVVWAALWRYYFRHRIDATDTVLDLGCGYGDFINHVIAKRRIALDLWPEFVTHIAPGIETLVTSLTDLSALEDGTIDYAFASNVVEHVTKEEFASLLACLKTKLSARGRLTLIQPNYRYASAEYFDDYTHISIWSHVSLADFLTANGYEVIEIRPRFLPLTVISRIPVFPPLIGLYLISPFKPLGKQMLLSARAR